MYNVIISKLSVLLNVFQTQHTFSSFATRVETKIFSFAYSQKYFNIFTEIFLQNMRILQTFLRKLILFAKVMRVQKGSGDFLENWKKPFRFSTLFAISAPYLKENRSL
jgi:hypothetical protein